MTFNEHWQKLCRIVPQLGGDESTKMTISIGSFKAALKRAYEVGSGSDEAKRNAAKDFAGIGGGWGNYFRDTFGA